METDAAQVVHYSNYFRFFERAEEEFYAHLGFSFDDALKHGVWFPRVEAFCQYKKPARFNDLLEVELTIEELKEKHVKYAFRISDKQTGALVSEGHVVVVAADKQTGKSTQIPMEFAEKLKRFLE